MKGLSIPFYTIMRVAHDSNIKRSGVCLYYKEHSPIIWRDDISNLKNCLVKEITIKMNDVSSRAYIGPLAKIVNSPSPFVFLLEFLWPSLTVSIHQFQWLQRNSMENVQSGVLLILLTTLERNLITLHRPRGTFKLLTNLTILQTIHLPSLAIFLHLILA